MKTLRFLCTAPFITLASLLGVHDTPKLGQKDFSMLIMAIAVIAAWGLVMNYLLTPSS